MGAGTRHGGHAACEGALQLAVVRRLDGNAFAAPLPRAKDAARCRHAFPFPAHNKTEEQAAMISRGRDNSNVTPTAKRKQWLFRTYAHTRGYPVHPDTLRGGFHTSLSTTRLSLGPAQCPLVSSPALLGDGAAAIVSKPAGGGRAVMSAAWKLERPPARGIILRRTLFSSGLLHFCPCGRVSGLGLGSSFTWRNCVPSMKF